MFVAALLAAPLTARFVSPAAPIGGAGQGATVRSGKAPTISGAAIPTLSSAERRKMLQQALPKLTIGENLPGPKILSFLNPGSEEESLGLQGPLEFTNEKGGVVHLLSPGSETGKLYVRFRVVKDATYAFLFVGRSTVPSVAYSYGAWVATTDNPGSATWGTGEAKITSNSKGFVIGVTAKASATLRVMVHPTSGGPSSYCEIQRIEITRL